MTRIGVIGTGYWGKNHVRTYSELVSEGKIEKVVICDIDEKRAMELGKAFNIEYLTDYSKLLKDPKIDAVSIVTPSATHYKIAKEFMEAGKDVLVEKPMTMDSIEAGKLVEISERTGQNLMVGHIFRYHPAVRELKRRIELGELGTIRLMSSNRLYYGAPRSDMGVIYALGIHEVDMYCHLMNVNYPKSIIAITSICMQKGIEETAMISMDFGDVKGYAFESWLMPSSGKQRDLIVVGSEKSAKIDYLKPQELKIFDIRISENISDGKKNFKVDDEGSYTIPIPYSEPLKEELNHFIHCIKTREKTLSDGIVGMHAVVMAEKALESARTGRIVVF
jgi:predicted dehydrogenase